MKTMVLVFVVGWLWGIRQLAMARWCVSCKIKFGRVYHAIVAYMRFFWELVANGYAFLCKDGYIYTYRCVHIFSKTDIKA